MKNILVPIDFSVASHNASEYAACLATAFNANLIFVYSYLPPIAIGEVPAVLLASETQLQEENRELMNKEIKALGKKYSVEMDSYILNGDAATVINKMVLKHKADAIVMGMKGKGKSSGVFGSTTHGVIRKATVPVVVVPEKAFYKPIRSIIFAADFDLGTSMGRHSLLLQLAEKNNAYIQVLHVQKQELVMDSNEIAGKMKTNLGLGKIKHDFFTIEDADVEDGIQIFMDAHPAELLAMVAHKHSIFERLFSTSHTKAMSYLTTIPMLVLQDR